MGRAACEGFDADPIEIPRDLLKCIADLLQEKQPEAPLIDDGEDFIDFRGETEITRRWKCGACGKIVCHHGRRPPIRYCHVCGTKFKDEEAT